MKVEEVLPMELPFVHDVELLEICRRNMEIWKELVRDGVIIFVILENSTEISFFVCFLVF